MPENPSSQPKLTQTIGPWQLMFYGLGSMLGAGIYALIGKAAAGLGNAGIRVLRFEFPYMAGRRAALDKLLPMQRSDFTELFTIMRGLPVTIRIPYGGGIGAVEFTMVADVKHEITRAYGIEHEDGVALRASFLIDRAGVVQHQVVNNLPLGREVDEMVRLVEALQFTEEHGEVCPAGWRKGQKGMKASAEGVASYLAENAEAL